MTAIRPSGQKGGRTTKINGTAMRVIRERSGMSVVDVVASLREQGISAHRDYIYNLELGNRQPSPVMLKGLAEALACPIRALLAAPDEDPVGSAA